MVGIEWLTLHDEILVITVFKITFSHIAHVEIAQVPHELMYLVENSLSSKTITPSNVIDGLYTNLIIQNLTL